MALKVTPQESVNRWQQRTAASTQDFISGISKVSTAPGQAAAAQADAYIQGVTQALNKWKRNVAAVSLEEWKDKAINVGAPRIASGVNAAMAKTLLATERNFANIEAALTGLPARGTFDQNVNRMVQFVTKLHDESNR